MRLAYFLLVTAITLFSNSNAEPAATESISKKMIKITIPETNDTAEGMLVQDASNRFLILRLGEEDEFVETAPTENSDIDDESVDAASSFSNKQEERSGINKETVSKIRDSLRISDKTTGPLNAVLKAFFKHITPKDYRLTPGHERPSYHHKLTNNLNN